MALEDGQRNLLEALCRKTGQPRKFRLVGAEDFDELQEFLRNRALHSSGIENYRDTGYMCCLEINRILAFERRKDQI